MRGSALALAMGLVACAPAGRDGARDTPRDDVLVAQLRSMPALGMPAPCAARAAHGVLSCDAHVRAPLRARAAARVGHPGLADAWLEIAATDVADQLGRVVDGAVVHRRALPDADVILTLGANRLEDLTVLRSPRAPHVRRWSLTLGPGLDHIELRDGAIRAVDRAGVPRIAADAPFAIDAAGVRRAAPATVEKIDDHRWEVVVRVDADGATYPLVLDPVWSATSDLLTGRAGHGSVRLASGKVMVLGGLAERRW